MINSKQIESLNCPRCGKKLDDEHILAIGRGLLAVAVLGDHLRSIEKRDLYCVECFDETEKREFKPMSNKNEEYVSPQSFELKKNIEDFKSGLVKKSKDEVNGIERLYEATLDLAHSEKTVIVIPVRGDDLPKYLLADVVDAIRPYLKEGVELDWGFAGGQYSVEISRKCDQKTHDQK
jgi:hypothetical protein